MGDPRMSARANPSPAAAGEVRVRVLRAARFTLTLPSPARSAEREAHREDPRMSDDPFAEPDDSERTVIRPAPGGRRPAAARGRAAGRAVAVRRAADARHRRSTCAPMAARRRCRRRRGNDPVSASIRWSPPPRRCCNCSAGCAPTLSAAERRRPARAHRPAGAPVRSARRATPACRTSNCARRITRCAPASTTWC